MDGLLDWLTGSLGGGGGGPSPGVIGNPMGDMQGANPMTAPPRIGPPEPMSSGIPPDLSGGQSPGGLPTGPMPPMQQTGADIPPSPFAQGGDPMSGGGQGNGPGLPPPLPPPIEVARRGAPDASMLPPNATSTSGPMSLSPADAANVAQSYQAAGGNLAPPVDGQGNVGFLGRALGMDVNSERSFKGSLAAGLKSVGENAHKPGLAAFSGSAGSAMEGGQKAEKDTTAEQSKYLNDAIKAQASGDTQKLNIARTKLALAQAKATMEGKDTKASVMNSKEQLYLRGLGAVNQDARVKASAAALRSLAGTGGMNMDSPEYKAAQKTHDELIETTKKGVFADLGVDSKAMQNIGKKPGFAADNPVPKEGLTADKFKALPEGAYFVNPKDGRLLQKRGAQPQQQGGAPAIPTMPTSPTATTMPAGTAHDDEE